MQSSQSLDVRASFNTLCREGTVKLAAGFFCWFWGKTRFASQSTLVRSAVAYLMTEVLGSDAENVQAHGGLLELVLKALQLQGLLLTAFPQLLDQSPVQLLGPFSLNCCCPPTNYRTKYSEIFSLIKDLMIFYFTLQVDRKAVINHFLCTPGHTCTSQRLWRLYNESEKQTQKCNEFISLENANY